MYSFLTKPTLFDLPLRLTKEEQQNPDDVLTQFCTDYRLYELRDYQWSQLEVCLTTDNTHFSDPGQRADLLYRHQQMEKVFEAIFLLFQPGSAGNPFTTENA